MTAVWASLRRPPSSSSLLKLLCLLFCFVTSTIQSSLSSLSLIFYLVMHRNFSSQMEGSRRAEVIDRNSDANVTFWLSTSTLWTQCYGSLFPPWNKKNYWDLFSHNSDFFFFFMELKKKVNCVYFLWHFWLFFPAKNEKEKEIANIYLLILTFFSAILAFYLEILRKKI